MSLSANYPTLSPSLLLDFAGTKQLDPRITFTRATTATYYNGVTVAKAEENLLLYSQEFDNAWWLKTNSTVTSNTVTAPDGTTTAETVNEGTATGTHQVNSTNISFVSGLAYTTSFFVKADTVLYVQIILGSAAFGLNAYANFDVSTGVLGTVGSSATATITSVGNSWYRCTMTATATSSASVSTNIGAITTSTSARAESYTGTSKVFYLWGAQLEQRSSVTAYTATTTQPITNYIPVLLTAASGVARFDHNPTTGVSLGLLIEEQRTNFWLYSEDITNLSGWGYANSTQTANTNIAPNGTQTADTWGVLANGAATAISNAATITAGATVTHSVYIKKAFGADWVYLALRAPDASNEAGIFINISTGAIGNSSVLAGTQCAYLANSASAVSVGNGWYRISAAFTTNTTTSVVGSLRASRSNGSINDPLAGDAYFLWGRQGEVGSFATSYIATVASTVTRNADAVSMTGTNFSSWYNASEGTLYGESLLNRDAATGTFPSILEVGDGTTSNRMVIFAYKSGNNKYNYTGTRLGVEQWNLDSASTILSSTTVAKTVGVYKTNDIAFSINAISPLTDTSATLPTVSVFYIGSSGGGLNYFGGYIRKIAYYPVRVTNAQLQALTTV